MALAGGDVDTIGPKRTCRATVAMSALGDQRTWLRRVPRSANDNNSDIDRDRVCGRHTLTSTNRTAYSQKGGRGLRHTPDQHSWQARSQRHNSCPRCLKINIRCQRGGHRKSIVTVFDHKAAPLAPDAPQVLDSNLPPDSISFGWGDWGAFGYLYWSISHEHRTPAT